MVRIASACDLYLDEIKSSDNWGRALPEGALCSVHPDGSGLCPEAAVGLYVVLSIMS